MQIVFLLHACVLPHDTLTVLFGSSITVCKSNKNAHLNVPATKYGLNKHEQCKDTSAQQSYQRLQAGLSDDG